MIVLYLLTQIICLLKHLVGCGDSLGAEFVSYLCSDQVYHLINNLNIGALKVTLCDLGLLKDMSPTPDAIERYELT